VATASRAKPTDFVSARELHEARATVIADVDDDDDESSNQDFLDVDLDAVNAVAKAASA
jgi:hypothetical protein